MLPEYHEQELVAGSTTITGVTSGKVVVTLHWGINRTATFRVFVPDTTEITLAELALQKYDSDPAVVSKVADAALRAEDAADRAEDVAEDFGSLEGVRDQVQAATDAASSASGSASAAASSASAAATSESNAAGSASSAGTSASSAASSASDAAGSASTASGAAASTAGSASQAASSATAAASSASAAASSASTAEDAAARAEAGASTVGDAQAILAARDQAVTAKDGAVTAQTAAEAAATSAASAAATEVNKLKAGAPEAFDTLLEIANELGENETERAALANSIAGKANADHNHHGDYYTKDQADGRYVSTSGTSTKTGDLTMDGGSMRYLRPETTGGWARGIWWLDRDNTNLAGIGVFGNADVVNYFYIGHGDEPWSGPVFRAFQDRVSITNLEVTGDVTGIEAGDVGAAPVTHTHRVLDFPMTDRTNWINNSSHPGKFVYTRPDGYLHGDVPTDTSHVANKQYVDARTPEIRVVTTMPASPTPGVVYLKFG